MCYMLNDLNSRTILSGRTDDNQMKCSVYSNVIIGPASAALARGLTFIQGNTSSQKTGPGAEQREKI